MQVVPTPLEKTIDGLFLQINRLSPYYKTFQIDISDGIYSANRTVQIEEISAVINQYNNTAISQLSFDFHLMVKDYQKDIEKLLKLRERVKITNIFIHYSLFPNYRELAKKYSQFQFGLVLNAPDSVTKFNEKYPNLNLPLIQIMTIELGYQGLPFKPEMLQKIEQLRGLGYRSKISIDGSVNDQTLPVILAQKNKPDVLVVGSFLTKSGDQLGQRVGYLREQVG